MSSGDKIIFVRGACTHGSTGLSGTRAIGLRFSVPQKISKSDGGVEKHYQGKPTRIGGTGYFESLNQAKTSLAQATAANLIVPVQGDGSADTLTLKNALFGGDVSEVRLPEYDGGPEVALFGVPFSCDIGASDTLALMIAST